MNIFGKKFYCLVVLFLIFGPASAQEWPRQWTKLDYDDSDWLTGRTSIGYGDDDDITLLSDMQNNYRTVYLRRKFNVDKLPNSLKLEVKYDDGFIAYINGIEVARAGLTDPVDCNTYAEGHEADPYAQIDWSVSPPRYTSFPLKEGDTFDITPFILALNVGENILAIEVHNQYKTGGSSDLTILPRLVGESATESPQHIHLTWSQNSTDSSVTVNWVTKNYFPSVVEYGLSEFYTLSSSDTVFYSTTCGYYIHEVELTGLAPATIYHYSCGSLEGGWSENHTFTTAPAEGGPASFTFAAYGDSRSQDNKRKMVKDAVLAKSPCFSLHGGDLVEDGANQEQWNTWFTTMEDLISNSVLMPILGNHENDAQNYFDQFALPGNEQWYSFDYGNAHFVVLCATGDASRIPSDSEQYKWLEQDLESADQNPDILWKIVNFHCPVYSSGFHGSNTGLGADIYSLLEHYNVDLVFQSHDHDYERSKPVKEGSVVQDGEGIIYVVTGGAGAPLRSVGASDWTACSESCYHFCLVTINNTELSFKAIRAENGSVLDEFTITKPAPSVPEVAQATDGSGLVTVRATIQEGACKTKVEYSLDGGNSWVNGDPDISTVTATSGFPRLDNTATYQIYNIDTSAGANIITFKWDTKSLENGTGSLDNDYHTNVRIRITPNDGTADKKLQQSKTFAIDNLKPAVKEAARLVIQPQAGNSEVLINALFEEDNPDIATAYVAVNAEDYSSGTAGGEVNLIDRPDSGILGIFTLAESTLKGNDYISKVKCTHKDKFGNLGVSENTSPNVEYKYVKPYTPSPPAVSGLTGNSVQIVVNKHPQEAGRLKYAIYESSSSKYVQANGILGSNPVWQTLKQWGKITVTGLSSPLDKYQFQTKSRNPSDTAHHSYSESEYSPAVNVDNTAPAAITDLRATSGIAPGTIDLVWTAPGDDGWSGNLTGKFRVNYSTISNYQFSINNHQLAIPIERLSPLTIHQSPIANLIPGATYYFRIWTCDDVGNWSDISNGATTWAQIDLAREQFLKEESVVIGNNLINLSSSNPRKNRCRIMYWIQPGAEGEVKIEIFDLLGVRVKNIFVSAARPGVNEEFWAGIDEQSNPVGTGVYFVRVKTKFYEKIKRVFVLR